MALTRPAFIRKRKNSRAKRLLLDLSSQKIEQSIVTETQKERGELKFRPYHDPKSIFELLMLENFYKLLGNSVVFIQKTENLSDKLIDYIARISSKEYKFIYLRTHQHSLETAFTHINENATQETNIIWIIDSTSLEDNLGDFCRKITSVKSRNYGVWIRGYISDLHTKDISFFQAIFTFDMSDKEFDTLRTTIPLSDDNIAELRTVPENTLENNKVLVFLNYEKSFFPPLLKKNPKVLSPFLPSNVSTTVLPDKFLSARRLLSSKNQIIQFIDGDNIMGDSFDVGDRSTIINRSKIDHSFNQTSSESNQVARDVSLELLRLLHQLQETNPSATEHEQIKYIDIATSSDFKQRVISAFKEGADTAIDEFILENKYLKVAKAVVKGWLETSDK